MATVVVGRATSASVVVGRATSKPVPVTRREMVSPSAVKLTFLLTAADAGVGERTVTTWVGPRAWRGRCDLEIGPSGTSRRQPVIHAIRREIGQGASVAIRGGSNPGRMQNPGSA